MSRSVATRRLKGVVLIRRLPTRLFGDLLPRLLGRLGFQIATPKGRVRACSDDFSIEVPFSYAVPAIKDEPLAVICHIFHVSLVPMLLDRMLQINTAVDLFLSTDTEAKGIQIREAFAQWPLGKVTVRVAPNQGRDIAPKLLTFKDVYASYGIVLFLHSKQSPHLSFGEQWRDHLIGSLIGSVETVASIRELFRQRPDTGMVIPQHFWELRERGWIDWSDDFIRSRRLAWQMGFDLSPRDYVDFPSGSMFWSRSAALGPLLSLDLSIDDFQLEQGQIDRTTAHCIERLFCYVCEQAGFGWVKVSCGDSGQDKAPRVTIGSRAEIDRFVDRHRFALLNSALMHG